MSWGAPKQRDRWGRPQVITPDGGKKYYTRVSTLAKALSDQTNLAKWKCRQTAIGVARRPDLQALALSSPDDKQTMNRLVEDALSASASDSAANTGTSLHSFCEQADAGYNLDHLPADYRADIAAYTETMRSRGVKPLVNEQFVVCDELEAAGTLDKLVTLSDEQMLVADVKTGQTAKDYPLEIAMQVAIYAHSALYDPDSGERKPLTDLGMNLSTGLLIHLPAGQARCELYELDLTAGWLAACLAFDVRTTRKAKPISKTALPAVAG